MSVEAIEWAFGLTKGLSVLDKMILLVSLGLLALPALLALPVLALGAVSDDGGE